MDKNDKIKNKLACLGLNDEYKICFESIYDLCEKELVSANDVETADNVLDLFDLTLALNMDVITRLMQSGVVFLSLDGVVISPYAKIGKGTLIHPGTQIRSGVTVGENCVLGPNTVIEKSTIGNGCTVNATQVYESVLDDNVKIGPFCHVRPNSHLCQGVKIGDFVEIKNSTIGNDTHASHLTYIGDSDVGERVNFGCGTVTCNYDGYNKNRCVIGDDVFIGCNTNLIAPVTIGDGAYTAAGSTITDSVPENSLGIARARQTNKEAWASKFKEKSLEIKRNKDKK